MPSNWFFFKRVEPITGKIKEDENKKKLLMKICRSKKANDLNIGLKLHEYIEANSDPLIISNFTDKILSDDACKMDIETFFSPQ